MTSVTDQYLQLHQGQTLTTLQFFQRAFSNLRLQEAGWLQSGAAQLTWFMQPVWKVHCFVMCLSPKFRALVAFQMNLSNIWMQMEFLENSWPLDRCLLRTSETSLFWCHECLWCLSLWKKIFLQEGREEEDSSKHLLHTLSGEAESKELYSYCPIWCLQQPSGVFDR